MGSADGQFHSPAAARFQRGRLGGRRGAVFLGIGQLGDDFRFLAQKGEILPRGGSDLAKAGRFVRRGDVQQKNDAPRRRQSAPRSRAGPEPFVPPGVGSARCADRTPQRGVPTIPRRSQNLASPLGGNGADGLAPHVFFKIHFHLISS